MSKAHIVVREERGIRYLQFGPDFVQGAMRIGRPHALVLDYTQAMMAALLLYPRPRSALLIGLGAGSLAKFLHRHFPDIRVTVVEIDPRVVDVAREYFRLPDDPARLTVVIGDGAEYVQETRRRFDLILVDGFDRYARAGPLESLPFYLACHAALSDGGVLAANLFGSRRGFRATVRRIDSAFSGRIWELQGCEDGNVVVLAQREGCARLREGEIRRRAAELKAATGLDVSFALPDRFAQE